MTTARRTVQEVTERGRLSYNRRAWADAYAALSRADQAGALDLDDLERLATCAYLTGRAAEFRSLLERAHHLRAGAGDRAGAARNSFWLGLTHLLRGEVGTATGWLARAGRLVESSDCVEHGYLLLPLAEQQLGERRSEDARSAASRAVEIGQRFGDPDLVALARHVEGRALLQQRQVHTGLALLDEAMLAATTGELSPIVTGLLYCSVIEACQEVCAVSRAREWTSAFSRWCERQPDVLAFTGTCLVRRAEILQFQGAWTDAMAEATRACEQSARAGGQPFAAAFYQQGEILRLQGRFAAAEDAYRRASELGYDPQPGLALLRLVQGDADAACTATRRLVEATTDPFERTRLLPACIDIMLECGAIEEARGACAELQRLAADLDIDVLHALAAEAHGALDLADGNAPAAIGPLRSAFRTWQQLGAPYAAARVRVLIGIACRSMSDAGTAALEFGAARAVFRNLGAAPDLARLDAIEKRATRTAHSALTSRELQVLRLIAAGRTNRSIARELSLSERTIDRHVSNILTKLNVPSRAAATAFAYDHKLF